MCCSSDSFTPCCVFEAFKIYLPYIIHSHISFILLMIYRITLFPNIATFFVFVSTKYIINRLRHFFNLYQQNISSTDYLHQPYHRAHHTPSGVFSGVCRVQIGQKYREPEYCPVGFHVCESIRRCMTHVRMTGWSRTGYILSTHAGH